MSKIYITKEHQKKHRQRCKLIKNQVTIKKEIKKIITNMAIKDLLKNFSLLTFSLNNDKKNA
jgi:hypothetical protein